MVDSFFRVPLNRVSIAVLRTSLTDDRYKSFAGGINLTKEYKRLKWGKFDFCGGFIVDKLTLFFSLVATEKLGAFRKLDLVCPQVLED